MRFKTKNIRDILLYPPGIALSGSEEGKFHCAGRSVTGGRPLCGAAVERDSWTMQDIVGLFLKKDGRVVLGEWFSILPTKKIEHRSIVCLRIKHFTLLFYLFWGWYTWWKGQQQPSVPWLKAVRLKKNISARKESLPESTASWWGPPVETCFINLFYTSEALVNHSSYYEST